MQKKAASGLKRQAAVTYAANSWLVSQPSVSGES